MITNPTVLSWVEEMKALVKADKEIWINGDKEQISQLKQIAKDEEIIINLNEDKFPGCSMHRTTVGNAARAEQRTFICSKSKGDVSPPNNWMETDEAYKKLYELFNGVMQGKTMYIVPFCLCDPKSPLKRIGIEITDSLYTVLNIIAISRCNNEVFELINSIDEGDNSWFKGLHSIGDATIPSEDNRYICHFVEDNTVFAINTGYGSSAFLNREAMSLRLASYASRDERWSAEHMAIFELETPKDDAPEETVKTYIAAAFPPECGKTSLSMMEPPKAYKDKGYKVRCISDDIAWLKKGRDGRLWAINPEIGVFSRIRGVNKENNPNVLAMSMNNAILTNTGYNLNDNTAWWEGLDTPENANLVNWRGDPFEESSILDSDSVQWYNDDEEELKGDETIEDEDELDEDDDDIAGDYTLEKETPKQESTSNYAAHSNSRFTASLKDCPCLSDSYGDIEGVPISAIIFGGKRTKTIPIVYQAFDWKHGVFIGSTLGSEPFFKTTGTPIIRRDPMAMINYCGYNMADYFKNWLKIGKKLGRNAPKIFNINWFRSGQGGTPIWPGFGENIRVLDWIARRSNPCLKKPGVIESPIGYIPKPGDIDIEDLSIPPAVLEAIKEAIREEKQKAKNEFKNNIEDEIPPEIEMEINKANPPSELDEPDPTNTIDDQTEQENDEAKPQDDETENNEFTLEIMNALLKVDKVSWKEEVNSIKQFYNKFGNDLPDELKNQLIDLEKRLMNY